MNALATIAVAVALRTPRIGSRRSPTVACRASGSGGAPFTNA